MIPRAIFAGLVLVGLAGCEGAMRGSASGPAVFVDAAGNRVVVDVGPIIASAPSATRSAPADSPSPDSAVPSGEDGSASATIDYAGEQYRDAAELQEESARRGSDRFFPVQDGSGRTRNLRSSQLGMSVAPDVVVSPGVGVDGPRVIVCDPGKPLTHLVSVRSESRLSTLSFPAWEYRAGIRERRGGYLLSIPPDSTSASIWVYAGKSAPAIDVAVLLLDADGRVVAVVNNFATESVPETLFRYAKVGGEFPLFSTARPTQVAVIEGLWARRMLPPTCPPGRQSGPGLQGQVTVEFLNSARDQ